MFDYQKMFEMFKQQSLEVIQRDLELIQDEMGDISIMSKEALEHAIETNNRNIYAMQNIKYHLSEEFVAKHRAVYQEYNRLLERRINELS